MRHETAGARGAAGEPERLTGQAPSGHDGYIVRGSAVAVQPDGHRALFTNIDPDPVKRAKFWELVEEHERAGGPDQMSCRFADRPDFWARVVQHPDCPEALHDEYQRAGHDRTARFDIEAGDAMRTFLARQDGWIRNRKRRPDESKAAFEARELPFASFHDGRRGRTQYRIVGELPDELSMKGRVQLLRDFSDEFRRRRIPFVAVMHAPDHNNDEKNWHFHLIYYDRPCARITAAQIAELDRKGYDIAKLEVGMWDFAAVTNKRNRVNRPATPLQQNKVGEVGNDHWIGNLRRSFAARTNAQLEKERIERRVDPRRHADMGIPGDPQEHLGTRQAAAETRGVVTPIGRMNEERQSRTIETMIEQKHASERAAIARQVEQWQIRSVGRPAAASSIFADALNEFSDSLTTAAALDRLAAQLRHGMDRAGSRATHVRRTNDQLVRAIDADPAAGSARERRERAGLVEAASDYLEWLGITLSDERQLIAECDAEAGRRRTRAATIEAQLVAAVSVAPAAVGITPSVTPATSGVDRGRSHPANAGDLLDLWITQIEAGRPYIRGGRSGFSVTGHATILAAGSDAQARLAVLHRRQQHEISRIANHLRARPTALAFDIVDGRRSFRVKGLDPDLAKAFLRYRDGPELIAVIDAALNPDQGARSRLGAGGDQRQLPTAPPAALAPTPHPVATPPSSEVEIGTPPARVAATVEEVPVLEPTGASSSQVGRDADPPSVDVKRIVRELIAARIPLTIAQDHFIDRAALRAGKVDDGFIEMIRRDPLLVICAADQIEEAFGRVRLHVARHPNDLALRPGSHSLEGDAPADLVALAKFHSGSPRWRQQIDAMYSALHPVALAPASMAPVTPVMPVTPDCRPAIERHPERFSTVEPDLALRAEARKYALERTRKRDSSMEPSHTSDSVQSVQHVPVPADTSKDRNIIHGEAARRAAQRAAIQRGS